MNRVARMFFGALVVTCVVCVEGSEVSLFLHFVQKSEANPFLPCDVLRFEADITGDGTPELFLAQSQSIGNSGIETWLVYAKLEDGRYRFLGSVGFSDLGFRISSDSTELIVYYDTERGTGVVVTYRVGSAGFEEVSREDGVSATGTAAADFESWRKQVGLRLLSADLKDLEASAEPKWIDASTMEVVPGVAGFVGLVVVQ